MFKIFKVLKDEDLSRTLEESQRAFHIMMKLSAKILSKCFVSILQDPQQFDKDLTRFMSFHRSVDRVPTKSLGGHGFNSCRDSDLSLSHACDMMNIPSFILQKYITGIISPMAST